MIYISTQANDLYFWSLLVANDLYFYTSQWFVFLILTSSQWFIFLHLTIGAKLKSQEYLNFKLYHQQDVAECTEDAFYSTYNNSFWFKSLQPNCKFTYYGCPLLYCTVLTTSRSPGILPPPIFCTVYCVLCTSGCTSLSIKWHESLSRLDHSLD